MADRSAVAQRRAERREDLIACAERIIGMGGLSALRARDLARDMNCAVGALYNIVADLDELVLLVARRTQNDLAQELDLVSGDEAGPVLIAWAETYLRFARANRNRWQALFEFRLAPGKALPDWFEGEQEQIFRRLEERLALLVPRAATADVKLKARSLFAAVHGIVSLGLEEKLVAMPIPALEDELKAFVAAYLRGLGG